MLTKETAKMLGPIDVAGFLIGELPLAAFHLLADLEPLLALEAVQQDAPERLVEILAQAGDDFFEEIVLHGAGAAAQFLFLEVGGQDLVDGVRVREGDEGEVLGDVFPVVDEQGFDVVGDGEADGGAGVECFFL